MIKYLLTWAGSLAVFLVVDLAWLGLVARDFYRSRLSGVIAFDVNMFVAGLFYTLHVAGVMLFVVHPASQSGSVGLGALAIRGALYGLFTYAAYDLTNLATVRHWPVDLAVIDMAWGMALNALVSIVGFLLLRRLGSLG